MVDSDDNDQRPDPDALLAAANQEQRGRLRIFLGAAPGVGKTYEMLLAARAATEQGIDVVVGVVETHGRAETEALLSGLEVIPRRRIDYRGQTLREMDLDAVLTRAPQLVLVDELAHTNAPGSRHPKRYLDVEEILAAGIDVHTTMNVQHLESLNDVVARITRIRVRETVPDGMLDLAAEIELVDLTPEQLIRRLHEGKVYVPDQAQRALKHYFSIGNLTALREMALRRTAQRVDEQMLSYMRSHAIAGPWAAGDRLLVCIDEKPSAAPLVRAAKRTADRLRCKWTAAYIETAQHYRLSQAQRDRISDTLRLAERLGGEAITLPGGSVAGAVLDYAGDHNVTQIIIGKSERPRWVQRLAGTIVDDLIRGAGDIAVSVLTGEGETLPPKTIATQPRREAPDATPYLISTGLVALAAGLAVALDRLVHLPNLSLLFLIPILISALLHGLAPSLLATLLSIVAYNFLFMEARQTFATSNVLSLLAFTAVAIITSNLTARSRRQTVALRHRARVTAELNAFSRKLAGTGELDDVLWATAHQAALMLKAHAVVLMPEDERLSIGAAYPPRDDLTEQDYAAAKWCWDHARPAGWGSETLPGVSWLFLPLRTERGLVGVLGIELAEGGTSLTPEDQRLLDAIRDQAAVSIERVNLADEVEDSHVSSATGKVRKSLLASISRHVRAPVAAIQGATTALRDLRTDKTGADLIAVIGEEADRLSHYIETLTSATRPDGEAIEHGPPHIERASGHAPAAPPPANRIRRRPWRSLRPRALRRCRRARKHARAIG